MLPITLYHIHHLKTLVVLHRCNLQTFCPTEVYGGRRPWAYQAAERPGEFVALLSTYGLSFKWRNGHHTSWSLMDVQHAGVSFCLTNQKSSKITVSLECLLLGSRCTPTVHHAHHVGRTCMVLLPLLILLSCLSGELPVLWLLLIEYRRW